MTSHRQPEPSSAGHPAATRWLALVCLLLFGWVSTAQAAHIHGKLRPRWSPTVQGPATDASALGGEEHCPLCVAVQPSLPISLELLPLPAVPVAGVLLRDPVTATATPWHPCSLSRPPPFLA